MANHTPGPWKAEPAHLTNKLLTGDDNYIRITSGEGFRCNEHSTGFELTGFMFPADARLIQAAPDMYELLRKAAKLLDQKGYSMFAGEIEKLLKSIDQ